MLLFYKYCAALPLFLHAVVMQKTVQRTPNIWCAGHAVTLKGESPEGAVMTGIL